MRCLCNIGNNNDIFFCVYSSVCLYGCRFLSSSSSDCLRYFRVRSFHFSLSRLRIFFPSNLLLHCSSGCWLATSNPLNNRFSYQFSRVLNKLLLFKFTLTNNVVYGVRCTVRALLHNISTHKFIILAGFFLHGGTKPQNSIFYWWYDVSFFSFFLVCSILIWLNNRKLRSREYGVYLYLSRVVIA